MKKIATICALALAIGLGNMASAAPAKSSLLWPLDIEISQSSSFAEFRGMRFHAGIDLRTKQTNGLPVYAIEDGFISRASVQFTGYGYALYIDHPNINARVVYGHLKCFNGPIQKHIESKLKEKNARHGINLFFKPKEFPVKKGQIIAYSGESGAGPSHLHFEMRNFKDDPIAPAKFGYRPQDTIYPNVYNLYVEPMEYGAVIDGSFLGKCYPIKKRTKSLYEVKNTPVVCGKVGIQAGISDTNGAGNKYGIETISLTVNGKKLIQRDFYQYSYDTNRQCPWVYDYYKSNQSGTGYVYNLFKWPFDSLPFAAGYTGWSGILSSDNFDNQGAKYEIFASDFGQNSLSIKGNLTKIDYDFQKPIAEDEISSCAYNKAKPYMFGQIVTGNNPFGRGGDEISNIKTGYAVCLDSKKQWHNVPCIIKGSKIELAFPNEPCWQDGAWIVNTQVLFPSVFIDSNGGTVKQQEGAEVIFNKNSVHFPVMATMQIINSYPNAGGNAKSGFLKPFSAIWQFAPDGIIFDKEVKVRIKPNQYPGNINKLGVYNVSSTGKYSHNGETEENGYLTFTTRSGGTYLILEDNIPPEVTYSRHFTHYQLGDVYAFKATDLGEGVAWLNSTATINGTKCETYADNDKKEVYVLIPPSIKLPRKVTLTVKDNVGNARTINHTISK